MTWAQRVVGLFALGTNPRCGYTGRSRTVHCSSGIRASWPRVKTLAACSCAARNVSSRHARISKPRELLPCALAPARSCGRRSSSSCVGLRFALCVPAHNHRARGLHRHRLTVFPSSSTGRVKRTGWGRRATQQRPDPRWIGRIQSPCTMDRLPSIPERNGRGITMLVSIFVRQALGHPKRLGLAYTEGAMWPAQHSGVTQFGGLKPRRVPRA